MIKLTKFSSMQIPERATDHGKPIWVNMARVMTLEATTQRVMLAEEDLKKLVGDRLQQTATIVSLTGEESWFYVQETPEQILLLEAGGVLP